MTEPGREPPPTANGSGTRDMAGRLLCFTLGAILPLASVGWLIAFH
jgi:hypothetical protein